MPKAKKRTGLYAGLLAIAAVLILLFTLGQGSLLQGNFGNQFWTANATRGEVINAAMIDAGHPITPCTGAMYNDVPLNHPYCDAIESGTNLGFVQGLNGQFLPNNTQLRAEAAKIIVTTHTLQLANPTMPTYNDVAVGVWYYQYVEGLNANGTTRASSGNFYPSDPIKRKELKWWLDHM